MKIELGKKYMLRSGDVVGPIQNIPPGHKHPDDFWYDPRSSISWQADGRFDAKQGFTGLDIVCEVPFSALVAEPVADGHGSARSLVGVEVPFRYADVSYDLAADDALAEVRRAVALWPDSVPFNTMHEGFAIINEEFDELKEQVWMNQRKRDLAKAYKEAIQLAAMAIRFAAEMCTEERGRK